MLGSRFRVFEIQRMHPPRQEVLCMHEWVPVILSFCLGAGWRLPMRRPASIALATAGIGLIAFTAFVTSGEFNVSWTYFLLDFIEASLGFVAGTITVRAFRHAPGMHKAK
jgi:hypothetical protein